MRKVKDDRESWWVGVEEEEGSQLFCLYPLGTDSKKVTYIYK